MAENLPRQPGRGVQRTRHGCREGGTDIARQDPRRTASLAAGVAQPGGDAVAAYEEYDFEKMEEGDRAEPTAICGIRTTRQSSRRGTAQLCKRPCSTTTHLRINKTKKNTNEVENGGKGRRADHAAG